ncbi:PREDICTED: protein FAM216A [Elephantulus edwardii]|uniref:protein FAM216A n=1 Tax=Elephantulus edwardii TaxID=28737 RepID=UPI0003F0B96A|nr:PREDICTED: protein FAM216A [Elephantulus edwardii]
MPGQGQVSNWTQSSSSAERPAAARLEGGGGGSSGHSNDQNAKGTEELQDGHRVDSHIAKLHELWKTPQLQTVHIPKSMKDATFRKHPDLTAGQKRYLCSIAKIYNTHYLRMFMKRQCLHVMEPGVPAHQRGRLSSQKQPHPCTTWRHQLERAHLGPPGGTAGCAPEMITCQSLWRPVRDKEGLKTGFATKTRCKSLKIFRKPSRLFMQPVSLDYSEPYVNDEKKEEDFLNQCMQSMSIEEQGEHLMLT